MGPAQILNKQHNSLTDPPTSLPFRAKCGLVSLNLVYLIICVPVSLQVWLSEFTEYEQFAHHPALLFIWLY